MGTTIKPTITLTDEWQEVPEDGILPPGFVVRMDLKTGKNYAKLDSAQGQNTQGPEHDPAAATLDFLHALYGDKPPAHLCIWRPGKTQQDPGLSSWFMDLDKAAQAAINLADTQNVYVGLGLQPKSLGMYQRGKADTVAAIPGLWLEVDVLNPLAHAATNLPPTYDAAQGLLSEFPLPPSILVHSGHGLQAYWLFPEPWEFQSAQEREEAHQLMVRFQTTIKMKATRHGWTVDGTADLARVLRLPGTVDRKPNMPPVPVTVLEWHPDRRYKPADFEPHLTEPTGHRIVATAGGVTHIEPILAGCAWLRHCRDDAANLDEPSWYAMLSVVGRCQGGADLAHAWSQTYPGYNAAETDVKLKHALQASGPRTCSNIIFVLDGAPYCTHCTHCGKVTSPINLGFVPERFHHTDLGNARRLVARHGANIRYCTARKHWLVWDGRRWAPDETGEIRRLAADTVRQMYGQAADEPDEAGRKALAAWALKSESRERLDAMVSLAQSAIEVVVRATAFNADPWLLNVQNGTLELRTGYLREHRREDLITKLAPVNYDPHAACPTWEAFVRVIMGGKQDLIDFLQRATGYTLTGDTSEQAFFMLYGMGSNGKSTLLELLRKLLGDHAKQSEFSTFLSRDYGGARNDIAALADARLVTASETGEGRQFAEVILKQLVGNDTISARFLYSEFFEFKPQLKLWLAMNHRPVIGEDSHAMWRRVRLVPFVVTIPDDQQDKKLPEKLDAELPGILAWAVRGCLEWQKSGLGLPAEVDTATRSYRADMDVIGAFLGDSCVIKSNVKASATPLYTTYKLWCEQGGHKALTQTTFGTRLAERGYEKGRESSGRVVWYGIGLKAPDGTEPPEPPTPPVAPRPMPPRQAEFDAPNSPNSSKGYPVKSLYEENSKKLTEMALNYSDSSEPPVTRGDTPPVEATPDAMVTVDDLMRMAELHGYPVIEFDGQQIGGDKENWLWWSMNSTGQRRAEMLMGLMAL